MIRVLRTRKSVGTIMKLFIILYMQHRMCLLIFSNSLEYNNLYIM